MRPPASGSARPRPPSPTTPVSRSTSARDLARSATAKARRTLASSSPDEVQQQEVFVGGGLVPQERDAHRVLGDGTARGARSRLPPPRAAPAPPRGDLAAAAGDRGARSTGSAVAAMLGGRPAAAPRAGVARPRQRPAAAGRRGAAERRRAAPARYPRRRAPAPGAPSARAAFRSPRAASSDACSSITPESIGTLSATANSRRGLVQRLLGLLELRPSHQRRAHAPERTGRDHAPCPCSCSNPSASWYEASASEYRLSAR